MKFHRFLLTVAGLLALALLGASAAEPNILSPEIRTKIQELRGLPPEERHVKQREFMENLTPEQRQKIQEQLRQRGTNSPAGRPGAALQNLTPEQRESRLKQLQSRVDALEKKKSAGTITEQESKRLEQFRQMQTRLKQAGAPPEKMKEDLKP